MVKDNSGLLIASLVALVAIVSLVMILQGGSTGGVVVYEMSGSAHQSFGRAYGSHSMGVYGTDANRVCWSEGGQIVCHQATTASPVAGRNV